MKRFFTCVGNMYIDRYQDRFVFAEKNTQSDVVGRCTSKKTLEKDVCGMWSGGGLFFGDCPAQ